MRVVIAETAVANVVLGVARHSPDAKNMEREEKEDGGPVSQKSLRYLSFDERALVWGIA